MASSTISFFQDLATEDALELIVIYAGVAVAFGHALWSGSRAMSRSIWTKRPGKASWHAACLALHRDDPLYGDPSNEADNAWRKDKYRWTHAKEMTKGDWYRLSLGKPSVLAKVMFVSDFERNTPLKVSFEVEESPGTPYEMLEVLEPKNDVFEYSFDKPRKITVMRLTIIEPRKEPPSSRDLPPAWAITDIRLFEAKLFGRWRIKEI